MMTNDQMINQLKSLLGYPSIDLEIDNEQLSNCISNAILMAKDHMYVRRYKTYNMSKVNNVPRYSFAIDLSELDFDIVTDVYRGDMISPYLFDQFYLVNYAIRGVPASLVANINMRSNCEALINRSWKVINKKLYLDKYYSVVTIEFVPTVFGIEDVDDSYWVGWILRYSLALAKEMLSRVRGKFVVDSNPFKTDADTLASESSTEKASLLEEIVGRGFLEITR